MDSSALHNEKELLIRLQNDDYLAFEKIYAIHKEKMGAHVFRLLKSWDLVDDILQELFIRFWNNRNTIAVEKSVAPYLHRIVANLVNDHIRYITRDRKLAEETWHHISELQDPFDEGLQIKADQELFRSIERLPEQRKKVFLLCKIEKKSYAEVSKLLQISEAAVNDHITKVNRFVKDNYDKSIPFATTMLFYQIFS